MSAVMSTLSMISGGRRAHRKLTSSRKSGQFSDAGEERTRSQNDLNKQQRSASLQTLEAGGVVNLENLEAKMARIEVSLAGSRRREAARDVTRELDALKTALTDKDTLIQSLKKQLSASLSAARLAAPTSPESRASSRCSAPALSADERRALDERATAVRADLDARRNNILDLRRRLEKTHVTDNIDTRIQQAELQYQLGREELELQTLGEQARALAQLIEHADAAARRSDRPTLYTTVRECGGQASLVAAEAREGCWGASPRGPGLTVEWATDNNIRPGDRLVEINGISVIGCKNEELQRATSVSNPARLVLLRSKDPQPSPPPNLTQNEAASLRAELGSLRSAAEDAEKAKEGLRSDNTRLTHRISYLEEQVAELLSRHTQLQPTSSTDSSCITVNKSLRNVTNISISSEPRPELQVFQKGPDITALVARLPGPPRRPRSSLPPSPPARRAASAACRRADYSAETDAAIRMIERNQRHMERQRLKADRLSRSRDDFLSASREDCHSRSREDCHSRSRDDYLSRSRDDFLSHSREDYISRSREDCLSRSRDACHSRSREDCLRSDSDADPAPSLAPDARRDDIRKAADRIEESIKKTNWAERKTMSIIEQLKRSQRLRKMRRSESADEQAAGGASGAARIDGKLLESAHKAGRRTPRARTDEPDSECSERPAPPRKPLRLSLHKARSAHSLLTGSESEAPSESKRPAKRAHAAPGARGAERATPRPARRLGGALRPCEAPPDALYPPDAAPPRHAAAPLLNWC